MAVNMLGNAWLKITPRWSGLDRLGTQLQREIRIPIRRVGEVLADITGAAGRLGDRLGDAGDNAGELRQRLDDADAAAQAAASDVDAVRGQLRRAEAAAAEAAAEVGENGEAARRAAADVEVLRRRLAGSEAAAEGAAAAAEDLRRRLGQVEEAARRAGDGAGDLRERIEEAGGAAREAAEETESSWSKAFKRVGAGAGVAFAAAGAGAGVGLASALDMEPVIDKMVAGIGAPAPLAADLGKVAGDLYADAYGESMEQVTDALEAVWKSRAVMEDATNAELESVTAKAFDLAAVMREEVGPVMAAVGQLVRTGLAKDAAEALDILARAQQEGVNKAEDLIDTTEEYATVVRQLGLSGKTFYGLLSQGIRAGARDTDFIADALKEFTILVQEMPEGTAAAFGALGLSAQKAQADIAAGGPRAAGALDAILDRLRAVKDPAEQNAIAIGLFGTKAEDLQDALFALDPSSAVSALGNVEGAATRMGETLNDNAKTNLVAFKRQVEIALVNGLGGAVGALREASGWLSTNFGPAVDVGKNALSGFWAAASGEGVTSGGVVGVFEELGVAARDIGEKVMPGLRDLGDFVTGDLWPALQDVGGIGARLAEDLQPLAELVAGVLLTAFNGLGWVLDNVIGPALAGLTGFIRDNQTWLTALAVAVGAAVGAWYLYRGAVAVVTTVQWMWATRTLLMQAIMRSVQAGMAGMRAAVLALNTAFMANPIGIVIAALVALAAGFAYLWTHSESFRNFWIMMWGGIKVAAEAVAHAFMASMRWIVGALEFVGAAASAFIMFFTRIFVGGIMSLVNMVRGQFDIMRGIITTVFAGIKLFFELWWIGISTVFRVAFEVIRGIVSVFVNIFKGDWEGAWNAIKETTSRILGIVQGAIDRGLGAIKGAFSLAVDGIGKAWDGIKRVAASPVNFVINTVYNDGIRRAFNFVAGLIGVGKLPEASPIKLRRGGRLPGYGGGDILPALLEPGETIIDKDRTKMLAPIFAAAGVPGFGLGGFVKGAWDATGGKVVSGIADAGGRVIEWARGALAEGLGAALGPVRAGIRGVLGTGEGWKGWLGRLALSPLDKLVAWVRGKDEAALAAEGGAAGAGVQRWSGVASGVLKEVGQSLRWLPTLLRRMQQESGGSPTIVNKWDINWQRGHPSVGLMQVIDSTFRAHAGPYRNTGPFLYGVSTDPHANIYASAKYTLARYGSLAAWNRPGGYDNGGTLHPGWTLAYNGTGHDEYVVNPGRRPGAGATVTVANGAIQLAVDARGAADPREVEAAVRRASTDMLNDLTRLLQAGAGAA